MSSTRLTREVTYEVVDDAGGLVKLGADGERLEVAGSLSGQTELSTIIRRSIVETWNVPLHVLSVSTQPENTYLATYQEPLPVWNSQFTDLPRDANGWTIIDPPATANIMYVSTALGDDTAAALGDAGVYSKADFADIKNPTDPVYFQTFDAAWAYVRSGEGDGVFLVGGEEYIVNSQISGKVGKSNSERTFIASLGPQWAHFKFTATTSESFIDYFRDQASYQILQRVTIDWDTRNPTSPNFVGWAALTDDVTGFGSPAILTRAWGTDDVKGILVEGFKISHFRGGHTVQTLDSALLSDIVYRRGVVYNIFPNNTSHAIGAQASIQTVDTGEIKHEEVIYVRCGYYDTTETTVAEPTPLRHNLYYSGVNDNILNRIISYDPASIHMKFTSNVTASLVSPLTGVVTAIEVTSPIDPRTPQTGIIGVKLDNDTQLNIPFTSWSGSIYQIQSTDFTNTPVSVDLGGAVSVNIVKSRNVSMTNSLFVAGEVVASYGGNEGRAKLDTAARFSDFDFINNIADSVGEFENTGSVDPIGWGVNPSDNENFNILMNLFLGTENSNVANRYSINADGYLANGRLEDNVGFNSGTMELLVNAAGYNSSNIRTALEAMFVDPTRDVLKWTIENDIGTTLDDFGDYLTTVDWDHVPFPLDSIRQYIREGFKLINPIVLQDIATATITGDTIFTFNVAANAPVVTTWYIDDAIVADEETKDILITHASLTSPISLRAVATALDGTIVESTVATITQGTPRLYLNTSSDVILNINGTSGDIGAGKGFRFSVITTDIVTNTGGPFRGDRIRFRPSANNGNGAIELQMGLYLNTGSGIYISLPSQSVLWDGLPHTIEVPNIGIDLEEVAHLYLDGVRYENPAVITTPSNGTTPRFKVSNLETPGDYYVYDLEVYDLETGVVEWKLALDSGITDGIEAAAIGTGGATILALEGDWTDTPS